MRYINLRLTDLLTYLLTYSVYIIIRCYGLLAMLAGRFRRPTVVTQLVRFTSSGVALSKK